jgi:type VII secretion integral membrane protein EccD
LGAFRHIVITRMTHHNGPDESPRQKRQIMTLTTLTPRRVTVVTPYTRADLALPSEATIAELIPQLTNLVGVDSHDPTGSSGGWVLSRLGSAPYEPNRSVNSAGIQDGDILYLSPRSARMPPVVFDDVIDAIASAPEARPGLWGPSATRWATLSWLVALGGLGLLGVLLAGIPWGLSAAASVAISVILLGASAALARAIGDSTAAAVLATVAMAYAATAGALAPLGDRSILEMDRLSLLLAGTGLAASAAVAALAVGDYYPWWVTTTLLGLMTAVTTYVGVLLDVTNLRLAAVLGGLLIALMPSFAALSLRISRLPLPHVPVDVAEFRSEDRPTMDSEVLDQTGRADRFLTALLVVGVVGVGGCVPALLTADSRWALLLVVLWGVMLPLRSRSYIGLTQRAALVFTGAVVVLATAATTMLPLQGPQLLAFLLVLLILMSAATAYALKAPGRSPSPYWGRFLDIVEFIGAAAAIPIIGAILDLYSWVRGLSG